MAAGLYGTDRGRRFATERDESVSQEDTAPAMPGAGGILGPIGSTQLRSNHEDFCDSAADAISMEGADRSSACASYESKCGLQAIHWWT